ncbi:UNVERIFIED_CONTAM: hypothetical protein Slati_2200600 [Sesamum latifolium]|uniref:Uncharacterized protein n=1 Tax=Sesamum latifolium TaxID=2727402 RepID=A0AAW2WV01_9LAMI
MGHKMRLSDTSRRMVVSQYKVLIRLLEGSAARPEFREDIAHGILFGVPKPCRKFYFSLGSVLGMRSLLLPISGGGEFEWKEAS